MSVVTQVSRPAFRKPWSNGAKAYFEADTLEAALEGFRRKRKDELFHVPNLLEDGAANPLASIPCGNCGFALGENYPVNKGRAEMTSTPDKNSTWKYLAKTKEIAGGLHYYCSWSNLMTAILELPFSR